MTDQKPTATADWDRLERDVVDRIRALKAVTVVSGMDSQIYRDLVLPNLELLAAFCGSVEIEPEEGA